jgi:pimeloyl-ACP methyl ester carboxylesterase
MKAERFRIAIADERLEDMRRRIRATAWPGDFGNADWHYGVEQGWLQELARYWADGYDWRAEEARINALDHYRVEIDGTPIHFVHVRSGRPGAIPLLLIHGWPWTFWDWQGVIAELSADRPGPAFDLVVPSLPGVAFSSPLTTTGLNVRAIGNIFVRLMVDVLGYERFGAAGGDWGSMITAELGHAHPDRLLGVHLTMMVLHEILHFDLDPSAFAADEQWMLQRIAEVAPHIGSHVAVHGADPQTLAYAMADSPVGTAAWLWERRRTGSDCGDDLVAYQGRDFLCTLASLHWLTNTIGSSMRIYKEHFSGHGFTMNWPLLRPGQPQIPVPTGVAVAPKEMAFLPRAEVARRTDLRRWQLLPRGGHFLPAEQPELLAAEYRAFFGEVVG